MLVVFGIGVEHIGGDMFVSIPSGDTIFMKVRFSPYKTNFDSLHDTIQSI